MPKSSARMILLSLCFPGTVLMPALAQSGNTANGNAAAKSSAVSPTGYVPAANTAYEPTPVGPVTNGPGLTPTPMNANLPAPVNPTVDANNYVLGPEDTITVRVFAADDIPDRPAQIANDGTVSLPMIGQVQAAGLTIEQLQKALVIDYKKYFKNPEVTVQVTDFRSQPVSVAGNVNTPGVVQLRGNRNLLEVISMAGGLRADAGDSVLITRNLSEGPLR